MKLTKSELKNIIKETLREELTKKKLTEEIAEESDVLLVINRLSKKFPDLNFEFNPSLAIEMPIDCDSVIKVTSKSGKAVGYGFNDDFMTDDDSYAGPDLSNNCARACDQFRLDPKIRAAGIELVDTLLDDVDPANDSLLMTMYMMLLYTGMPL